MLADLRENVAQWEINRQNFLPHVAATARMRDRSSGSTLLLGEISVKKMLLLVTGFTRSSTAGMCTYLSAQGTPPAQQPPGTKVAVINIGHVFNNYVRAKAFKKELEDAFAPYKVKVKGFQDQIIDWKKQAQNQASPPRS